MFRQTLSGLAIAIVIGVAPGYAQTQTQPPAAQPPVSPMPAQTPSPTASPAAPQTTPSSPDATAPAQTSIVDTEHGTSIALLEHIQKVLDDAKKDKDGNVTIDRGMVDEMRAEVTQVTRSLRGEKP